MPVVAPDAPAPPLPVGAGSRRWLLAGAARLGLCLAAGGLMALSAGWPGSGAVDGVPAIDHTLLAEWAWLLQWVGLVCGGAALLTGAPAGWRAVALLAAVWMLGWQIGVVWWIYIGLHKYAGLSAPLSVASVVALGMYLASYSVLGALVWARWCGRRAGAGGNARSGPLVGAAVFGATWMLAELARALVMTGFPWAAGGYAHLHGPLRVLVPWIGIYGVSAVSACLAAAVVHVLVDRAVSPTRRLTAVATVLLVALGLWALPEPSFTQSSGEFEALLLQGNVSQEGKFDQARLGQAMEWHVRALSASHADVALAPETAIPVLESLLPAPYWERLRQRAQSREGTLLIGMPQGVGAHVHQNAMLGLGHPRSLIDPPPDGIYRYHKAHLVPFGEFTPPGFAWFTRWLDLPLPAFQSGPVDAPPMQVRTRQGAVQRIAPIICFEDLFGEELARRFLVPERAPTVLANGSNLAWFDDSPAIAQHLRIAQLRSLEFERPTLRATNTGATVLIDHRGQVVRALPIQTKDVLGVVVDGRQGLTPYAWWVARTGLWPLVLLAMGVLLAVAWCRRQQRAVVNRAARTG